ncbi:MAG: hypothetical protein LLG97_01505 [Deltaproteobacteria bacterium]|nr:hypothetical protein [Deltaproteobacteria bacterium]
MLLRKSNLFLCFLAVVGTLLFLMFVHAGFRQGADAPMLRQKAEMVRTLGITDLCLFTEASYTRHPSQSDIQTPFQDSPVSLEHFPSGALVAPPPLPRKQNGKLD